MEKRTDLILKDQTKCIKSKLKVMGSDVKDKLEFIGADVGFFFENAWDAVVDWIPCIGAILGLVGVAVGLPMWLIVLSEPELQNGPKHHVKEMNNKHIVLEPTSQRKYTADEALKLFHDIENSDIGNVAFKSNEAIAMNVEKEVHDLLNRIIKENLKLKKAYADFYGSEKNIPVVITKILNNQLTYRKLARGEKGLYFDCKYQTDNAYTDIAKLNFKQSKDGKKRQLDLNHKNYYLTEYQTLQELIKKFETKDVQEQAEKCTEFLSTDIFGTKDMQLGLMMQCKNLDSLNAVLTQCANRNNINVLQWIESYAEQFIQGKNPDKQTKQDKICSINGVKYILPDEPELTK